MKKVTLVLLLGIILSAAAFAQSGLGIGAGFQYGNSWRSGSKSGSGISLFLKAPSIPIYWGISIPLFDMKLGDETKFSLGVTGDYYFFNRSVFPEAYLGWFFGVGGYFKYWRYSYNYTYNMMDFGVRAPVGLSCQPLNSLEFFLDLAASIGFYTQAYSGDTLADNTSGLGGGWQGDFGVRFWF
jgi:hypothetical protein